MPGTIAPGSVCTELATAMDFLPTVARMAAAPLPPNKIDGHDIGTLLTGAPNAKSPYTEFFHYSGWRLDAVRSGRWKLHRPHTYNTLAGRPAGIGGEPARYQQHKIPAALFDLTNDISEQHDVSAEHRDVAKRLSGMLARMRDELGDDSPRVQGRAVRPPGRV